MPTTNIFSRHAIVSDLLPPLAAAYMAHREFAPDVAKHLVAFAYELADEVLKRTPDMHLAAPAPAPEDAIGTLLRREPRG